MLMMLFFRIVMMIIGLVVLRLLDCQAGSEFLLKRRSTVDFWAFHLTSDSQLLLDWRDKEELVFLRSHSD